MSALSRLIGFCLLVRRTTSNKSKPANENRDAPVQIGGQFVTINFVPVLVPPHRNTAKSRLKAKLAFILELTRRSDAAGSSTYFHYQCCETSGSSDHLFRSFFYPQPANAHPRLSPTAQFKMPQENPTPTFGKPPEP